MKVSSTERSRRYREKIKADPKKLEHYRTRERERDNLYVLKRFYRRNIVSIIEEEARVRKLEVLWSSNICPLHGEDCGEEIPLDGFEIDDITPGRQYHFPKMKGWDG